MHTISRQRMISANPFVVHVIDNDLRIYLDSLNAPSFISDTANPLWAMPVAEFGDEGGTAYIVSNKTMQVAVQGGHYA